MRSGWIGIVSIAVGLVCAGCAATLADPMGKENSLEEAQKKYTQLVRWGEIGRASEYVDPALRQDFLVHGPQLRSIHITDYETGTLDIADDEDSASVTVTYRAFSYATAIEKAIREEQYWYREGGLANVWHVRSELPERLAELKGPAR